LRTLDDDSQERRGSRVRVGPKRADQLDLLLGLADSCRYHRAAELARGAVDHPGARSQVVSEAVLHDVAGTDSRGVHRPRGAPRVLADAFGIEDRPRRNEYASEPARLGRDEPGE